MNQRRIGDGVPVMPSEADGASAPRKPAPAEEKPENRIFDKAEEAGERESLRVELEEQQAAKAALAEAVNGEGSRKNGNDDEAPD